MSWWNECVMDLSYSGCTIFTYKSFFITLLILLTIIPIIYLWFSYLEKKDTKIKVNKELEADKQEFIEAHPEMIEIWEDKKTS